MLLLTDPLLKTKVLEGGDMSAFSAPEWADVEPIAQDEGPFYVVPISVSMEFQEVHGYLRALLKRDEVSERALTLTAMAIEENAANHLTWQHRRRSLLALKSDLKKELEWVARLGAESPKNYQIWHHRRQMVESLGAPGAERMRTGRVLERDNKNYHCWFVCMCMYVRVFLSV
jgi:protein farnesyltransferase/geranylgeranyltransferase type-1 subunit alpha